ncbi:MAG: phosphoadenylyl-sulfate reductase [Legionellaceae bacterium]|nr:phosphoadenylyl-sulfate reductase [Legionellaceae bacterium]|tara:strand:- start:27 stop:770 length:744 start_codon:yes stop_codon:yes gene_type:complete
MQNSPRFASPDSLEIQTKKLETFTPQEILAWAWNEYAPRVKVATGFGAEGMVLIHMLAEIAPQISVFNLDTGYQFPESLSLKEAVKKRYGIDIKLVQPETSVTDYEKIHGGPVYLTDANQCCHDRKVTVLKKALQGTSAWLTAIRRDQSPTRSNVPILGWDKQFNLVKINPLANWNKHDVWAFIKKYNIPYNPLYDQGYTSIGCWPCTKKPNNSDERSGRWSGSEKTECGIHHPNLKINSTHSLKSQ